MKLTMTSALIWYQKKIGAYDKQSWEKTVDQRILRGVSAVPKKLARIKTELIDIDLVRGSAFPKAKPLHSWIAATLSGIIRVLLLPIYFTWWQLQTNSLVSYFLVILYILQIFAIYIFYAFEEKNFTDIPTSEVWTPTAMMLILGIVHSQIVATFSKKNSEKRITRTKRKRIKRKRLKSYAGSESKSSPEIASDTGPVLDTITNDKHSAANCTCLSAQENMQVSEICTKKKSDDESGLDVADVSEHHPKNKNSSVSSSCVCNSVCSEKSFCHSSYHLKYPKHTNHTKDEDCNSKTATCLVDQHTKNSIDTDNISSGEEFFIPKKRFCNNEQWKKYILLMKQNKSFKKEWSQTKDNLNARRFSDVGIHMRSQNWWEQEEKVFREEIHNSEDGFQSFTDPCDVNSVIRNIKNKFSFQNKGLRNRRRGLIQMKMQKGISSGESDIDTTYPNSFHKSRISELEWPLVTNTDCNSDSSDCSSQSSQQEESDTSHSENPFAWEMQESAATSFSAGGPNSDKGSKTRAVSCTIWEHNECKKVDLSVLDISSAIIRKVDSSIPSAEYLAMGFLFASIVAFLPLLFRLQSGPTMDSIQDVTLDVMNFTVPSTHHILQVFQNMVEVMLGTNWQAKAVVFIFMLERFTLSLTYFFLLSVAEKTFKQRFLYAKNFCYLTSSRRARRTDLPHFRLNKVRNIKTWLSVRSYLKKSGPQRSVDVIVSVAFILEVCVLSFLCVQLLKETGQFATKLHCWETLVWTLALGLFLLRFMTIGSKINKKYRNLSVLITEQINLYLHMEQKPHKKNELMLANSVLKLAADLLKELESPFKISGLSANPFLYNFTKVVVLSAFSAVLTEVLGFKLKLYKMKLK